MAKKKSLARTLKASDTRRHQLEQQLRQLRTDLWKADRGTEELRVLCTATITHVLVECGLMDVTIPSVDAGAVVGKWELKIDRVDGDKLRLRVEEREKNTQDQ